MSYAQQLAALAATVSNRYPEDEQAAQVAEYARQVVRDHLSTYHVRSDIPEGTRVLPGAWPHGADDGSGGYVVETTQATRSQGLIEVYWDGKEGENPCLESIADVILDTPGNRKFLTEHAGQAWAAPDVTPPVLDTVPAPTPSVSVDQTLYHVAPVSARESIQTSGLQPRAPRRWGDTTTQPPGVYLWRDPEWARFWAHQYLPMLGRRDPSFREPCEIWQVQASGLQTHEDSMLNGSCYTPEPIGPERLSVADALDTRKEG